MAATLLSGGGPSAARWVALLIACGLVALVARLRGRADAIGALLMFDLAASGFHLGLRPSHDRDWTEDQAVLPRVTRDGDVVTIEGFRRFRYRAVDDWDAAWSTERFDLGDLVGSDLGVEQFASHEAIAHTFVSFRFSDGRVLVASVEIRKERGEAFSPLRGLFKHYERMIVLGDERDLVELRAVHRRDTVYLYPMQVPVEASRAFLESLLDEAAALHARPSWYHTVTASCSSSLAVHLQRVAPVRWDPRFYLPGYADALAHELGWLGPAPLDVLREQHRIDERALEAAGSDDFSRRIR